MRPPRSESPLVSGDALGHLVNQTGAVVLSALLDGGGEAAVAALRARYATTAETARRDVTRLVDALLAHRLVVTS